MNKLDFGCCSRYKQCSDYGYCISPYPSLKSNCIYWNKNLSRGFVFYGSNPGRRTGCIYLIVDNRAFAVKKLNKNLTYDMGPDIVEKFLIKMNECQMHYSFKSDGFNCIITGTQEEPAHYRVVFELADHEYVVKNYNGYELTHSEANMIHNHINAFVNSFVISTGTTSSTMARRTIIPKVAEEHSLREEPEIKYSGKNSSRGWQQKSVFDFM
jgi:hypothetical protein